MDTLDGRLFDFPMIHRSFIIEHSELMKTEQNAREFWRITKEI